MRLCVQGVLRVDNKQLCATVCVLVSALSLAKPRPAHIRSITPWKGEGIRRGPWSSQACESP